MAYILVVEDDDQIARFVAEGFRKEGHFVEHARDADAADVLIEQLTFDLAIVDVMLRDGRSGTEMVREWRRRKSDIFVIFLSARNRVEDKLAGFKAGADDYVNKPFSFAELRARVDSVLRRTRNVSLSNVLSYGDISLDLLKRQVTREGKEIELHKREFVLLQLFLENAEQVLGKTMILERVWGYDFDPQTNVVDVLVSRLRSKIDRGFSTQIIHTIRGVGYVLKDKS